MARRPRPLQTLYNKLMSLPLHFYVLPSLLQNLLFTASPLRKARRGGAGGRGGAWGRRVVVRSAPAAPSTRPPFISPTFPRNDCLNRSVAGHVSPPAVMVLARSCKVAMVWPLVMGAAPPGPHQHPATSRTSPGLLQGPSRTSPGPLQDPTVSDSPQGPSGIILFSPTALVPFFLDFVFVRVLPRVHIAPRCRDELTC